MEDTYYERLSAQDSSFIRFDAGRGQLNIGAIAVFEPAAAGSPPLNLDSLRAHVESRLHLLNHYRQRVRETPFQGHPIWVDDDRFDLAYHVRGCALSPPGDNAELKSMVAHVVSSPLNMERPLWELWLVEGLENGGHALIAKVHHCLMDGVTGVGVLQALLSPDADLSETPAEPPPPWKARKPPAAIDFMIDGAFQAATLSTEAARNIASALLRPLDMAGDITTFAQSGFSTLATGLRSLPDTPLNRPIGCQRRVDWHQLDMMSVKDLKKRLDGTVNDVILAVVAGAARHFFRHRKASVKDLDLRVIVPVDTRAGPADDTFGNQVSSWFVDLPIAEEDPLERFQKIHSQTLERKSNGAEIPIEQFLRFADWAGSSRLPFWGVRLVQALQPYNMIVSNVRGPTFPLYLLGSRLASIYPTVPLFEGQGMTVAVMSYTDRMHYGILADQDVVPDVARFSEGLALAFEELRQVAEQSDQSARPSLELTTSPKFSDQPAPEPTLESALESPEELASKEAGMGKEVSGSLASAARQESTVAEPAVDSRIPPNRIPPNRIPPNAKNSSAIDDAGKRDETAQSSCPQSLPEHQKKIRGPRERSYAILLDQFLAETSEAPIEKSEEEVDVIEKFSKKLRESRVRGRKEGSRRQGSDRGQPRHYV